MNSTRSIAVLPFINLTSDKENEYFSDGITEEIINVLSKIDGLQVTSRTSSFYFKDKNIDLQEIGKQLNVVMILEGSVRKSGNNVRISAQLINSEDGFHYWSETYDHQLDDIFYVQDQISTKVAQKVREHLGHFILEEEKETKNENLATYELYLQSKFNFNKFQKEDIALAVQQIEQVINADPTHSKYFATKGIYYGYLGILNVIPLDEAFKISKEAALKALEIDNTDAEAHHAMVVVAYVYDGDIEKAQYHNKLSLKYKPNYPDALFGNSLIAIVSQNYDIALDGVRKAITIDPFSPNLKYYYAAALMRLKKLNEALKVINIVLEQIPFNTNSYILKGVILTRLGELDKALTHYKEVPISPSETVSYDAGLGIVYATMGNTEKANEYLDKIRIKEQNINIAYRENPLVIINILLGNINTAFEYIKTDIANKEYYLKFYRVNPVFDLLKEDKRYSILEKVFVSKGAILTTKKEKYAKSGIKNEQVDFINKRLIKLMKTKKPYLKTGISLKSLSNSLSESANHISQVINDRHKKNFFDFINEYRIHEMVFLLENPENKRLTLLALAHEAGFNSKTTFNAAFKKLKGKTPSQYFKEQYLID